MSELIQKLGIDGKLLLAQAANFLILLYVLHRFAYKPLLKALKERRTRVEEGLAKAEEADRRLSDAQEMAKDKLKSAEEESMRILRATEDKAKKAETDLLAEAHKKEAAVLENAERVAESRKEEAAEKFRAEAGNLIRQALQKAVGVKPDQVDEALVKHAVDEIKRAA